MEEKKKLENFALNILLADRLLCHSTYPEKDPQVSRVLFSSAAHQQCYSFTKSNEDKRVAQSEFRSEQGITLASAHNFQLFERSLF